MKTRLMALTIAVVTVMMAASPVAVADAKRILTKYSDSASYSTENKRYADSIISTIGQAKIHTLDEMKKLEGYVTSNDLQLKTELAVAKSELTNNMKRHTGVISSKIINLLKWLTLEFDFLKKHGEELRGFLESENGHHLRRLDTLINYAEKLIRWWEEDKFGEFALNFDKLWGILAGISKNIDPTNTDSNSLGNKLSVVLEHVTDISDAIEQIDKRIPGIDINGDGILKAIQQNADAMSLRLDSFSKFEAMLALIPNRLEAILLKMGDSNYPANDNHLPNAGNVDVPSTEYDEQVIS